MPQCLLNRLLQNPIWDSEKIFQVCYSLLACEHASNKPRLGSLKNLMSQSRHTMSMWTPKKDLPR